MTDVSIERAMELADELERRAKGERYIGDGMTLEYLKDGGLRECSDALRSLADQLAAVQAREAVMEAALARIKNAAGYDPMDPGLVCMTADAALADASPAATAILTVLRAAAEWADASRAAAQTGSHPDRIIEGHRVLREKEDALENAITSEIRAMVKP